MTTPTPPYPVVSFPRVPVTKITGGYEARCHHCSWTHRFTIRAFLIDQIAHHKHLHRTGTIPTETQLTP